MKKEKIKAIILAAGKSTRTYPLTINCPKPLLKILNTTIIEHNLSQIEKEVDEFIIVVGYLKEKIFSHLGKEYKGKKITYVEQVQQKGTGHAVFICKDFLAKNDKILIINGDDLYSGNDIKKLLKYNSGSLSKEVENPEHYGVYVLDKNNCVIDLVEKPKSFVGNTANIGCYYVDYSIFELLEKTKISERGEIELTSAILDFAKIKKKNFKIVKVEDYWIPVGFPWDYLEANVFMLSKFNNWQIKGKIQKNVVIEGKVFIDKGTIIRPGTIIEGPAYFGKNCIIGPQAYIRKNSIIMDNVETRAEIYDAVIMENTKAKHNCYIAHSVIGKNVNIGAGTITSDYRHDGKTHITLIKGQKIDTKRTKLGAFLGDNVKTGVGTLIYPGRKLWPNTTTLPGEIVKEDKIN